MITSIDLEVLMLDLIQKEAPSYESESSKNLGR